MVETLLHMAQLGMVLNRVSLCTVSFEQIVGLALPTFE